MNIFCSFTRLKFYVMKKEHIFFLLIFGIFLSSCSSKKNILYVQEIDRENKYLVKYDVYKVKADDILKIDILSETPEAALIFNPKGINPNINNSKEGLLFDGYQVSSDGYINFPSIGKIYVAGMTIDQIRDNIYQIVVNSGKLNKPSIDIKLLNTYFVVLGEVSNPGRYDYIKNNINILEAIGMAGDLTINGKRNDVKIIREVNGSNIIKSIDLTKTDFLESNYFQVISGDIIIVNPNITKIKNAGIIGNSGTLLSLLSFILSSIIVANN